MQHTTLHRLVGIALLGASAYILMLVEFPILPIAPWMKIDFSDIPILIGLFLFGVGGAFVITIIKLLLHSAMMGFACSRISAWGVMEAATRITVGSEGFLQQPTEKMRTVEITAMIAV